MAKGAPSRGKTIPMKGGEMRRGRDDKHRQRRNFIGIGIALGVALGVALDNIAVGIAIGIAIGAALSRRGGGSDDTE